MSRTEAKEERNRAREVVAEAAACKTFGVLEIGAVFLGNGIQWRKIAGNEAIMLDSMRRVPFADDLIVMPLSDSEAGQPWWRLMHDRIEGV